MSARQWFGVYAATVYNTADPLKQSRVQLRVPQVLGSAVSNWAAPLGQLASAPVIGTSVVAMFLGGDVSHPVFIPMGMGQ